MRTYRFIAFVAILLPLSGCAQRPSELTSADSTAIRGLYAAWATTTSKKDWTAAGNLMTDDQWLSDPNQAPINGREALLAWFPTNWPANMSQTWVVNEMAGYRDLAYARATATEVYTRPDGTQYTEHAMCLNTLRRQADGKWQFSRSSCHVVDPLPPPQPAKTP